MTESIDTTFTFTDADGFDIFVRKWAPAAGVARKAAVQIAHGAAEHGQRYARLGKYLAANGYLAYANDHRGHFKTAGTLERAGIAGRDGWNGMLRDAKQLTDIIKEENPGLPVFFFGHSMGSLLAQQYSQHWGDGLAGVVLSGTFGIFPELDALIAQVESEPQDQPSATFGGMFAGFNEPYPFKTGFEWLSRDEAEVQKYVDDPWCGFPFTSAMVADFLKGCRETWLPENEARIPAGLPFYFISGAEDPVGGNTATVTMLIERYRALKIAHIDHKFYPGARHELLNETNRDEVQQELLAWLDARLA